MAKQMQQPTLPDLPEDYAAPDEAALAFEAALDEEDDTPLGLVTALASEDVLRREWLTPEEDEAWQDL